MTTPELSAAEKHAKALHEGYDPTKVPAEGMAKILTQHCRIQMKRECGCAAGACALGAKE